MVTDTRASAYTHVYSFTDIFDMDRITEEKIKSAANVVDVVGDFIQLRKRGVEYQGLCPFHEDETIGNFSINPNKGIYKCFACGASGDAIKFLMEYKDTRLSYGDALRYLAKKYNIYIDEENERDQRWQNIRPSKPKPLIESHKELLVHPRDLVLQTMKAAHPNVFLSWLRSLPWNEEQRKRLEQVLWLYCVGTWQDGRVVFWQIDDEGRPRGGKMMQYGVNGKRDKDKITGRPRWVHNQEGVREHLDLDHHEYRSTLFGLHLLKRYPDAAINIVESEKTAIFTATMYGEFDKNLWLACGGLEFLKVEALRPLIDQGRRIWIWPDKDGVNKWREKVGHLLNDQLQIYTRFFERYWIDEDGEKADMCDINLRLLCHPETDEKAKARVSDEKQLGVLHDRGDEPFLDPEEACDPWLRWARERLRQSHRPKWTTSTVSGVKSIGEIINETPIINELL
jgi:hypothetical protein